MGKTRRTAALLAALAIAGCGGSGTPGNPIPGLESQPANGARASARLTIRIRIPKRRHARGLGSRYISAATKGMTFAFAGPSAFTDVVSLTPSSPSCSGSPLECTVVVALNPGSYHVTVNAYDQAPAGGAIPAGAKLLATARNVAASIVAGAANRLGFVLDGVPATIDINTLPSAYASTGGAFLNAPFNVAPLDADGDTIVGRFAVPVTLADSDTSGATAISTAGADHPPAMTLLSSADTVTLSYTGAPMGPATISATAGSAKGSRLFKVHNPSFVADTGGKYLKEILPNCFLPGCVLTISAGGFGDIVGLATDSRGTLYVADATSKEVVTLTPCFAGYCTAAIAVSGISSLKGIAVDANSHRLYLSSGSGVYSLTPSCTTMSCATNVASGAFSNPYQVAVDSSGTVYVADPTLGEVFKAPAGCATSSCAVHLGGSAFSTPQGVAVDASGNVFVADTFGSVFEMPNTCQATGCASQIGSGFNQPESVAVDDFDNVDVADVSANEIVQVPPGCTSFACEYILGGGFSGPSQVGVP